jgi:hypothetical protein
LWADLSLAFDSCAHQWIAEALTKPISQIENLLNLIKSQLVVGSMVELRGAWGFVSGDLLSGFQPRIVLVLENRFSKLNPLSLAHGDLVLGPVRKVWWSGEIPCRHLLGHARARRRQ